MSKIVCMCVSRQYNELQTPGLPAIRKLRFRVITRVECSDLFGATPAGSHYRN